ncbi:hypothetical protein Tco_0339089, partial [Tanacetum coccineum]
MVGRVADLRRWWVGLMVETVLGSDGGGRLGGSEDNCLLAALMVVKLSVKNFLPHVQVVVM